MTRKGKCLDLGVSDTCPRSHDLAIGTEIRTSLAVSLGYGWLWFGNAKVPS
jgi:hypothetical protein